MSVVSFSFLAFLFIAVIVYYIVPKKLQWPVLLVSSIVFYAYTGIDNLIFVGVSIIIAYVFSNLMQINLDEQEKLIAGLEKREARQIKVRLKRKRKALLSICLVLIIGILAFLKYYNFAVENINRVLGLMSLSDLPGLEMAVPMGISFYTFMMISYLVDIYNGKIRCESNFLKYAAYVLYFPHVTQGPISRYGELAPQIFSQHKFDFDAVTRGIWLMIWGFFKKLVIADRLSIFVNAVFDGYKELTGIIFLFAGIAYSIQIYCDFSGCMDIVRGASECFGIKLAKNFERPYFSKTLPEFWRRWHMSLGSFFKDYVFYPISTSKLFLKANKGGRRVFGQNAGRIIASCIPIMAVWFLTGLWHGAKWTYIAWGLFHGILICLSTAFEKPIERLTQRLHIKRDCISWSIFRMLRTFLICVIGRIIFMAHGLRAAFSILKGMFTEADVYFSIFDFGLSEREWLVAAAACIVLLCVSIAQEIMGKKENPITIRQWLSKQNLWFRWALLLMGIFSIVIFGVYGTGAGKSFIYEQF